MLSSPEVQILFYQEADGTCPALDFLLSQPTRVQRQAEARIKLLAERGHMLRRPHCDYLTEDLFELRWHSGRVQYRIIYCFRGRGTALLLHALTKEGGIPRTDLNRAQRRRQLFIQNPATHTRLFS